MNISALKSKLGIGTAQFGMAYGISNNKGKTSRSEVPEILRIALDSNINLIDTASAYGNAEQVLGGNDLNNFDVVSKFMPSEENGAIQDQLDKTLNDLRIPDLYGYLAHRPLDLVKNDFQWEQLQELKEKQKVKKIGFSLNTPQEYMELKIKGFLPDIVQVPFNYFDRRFEKLLIELSEEGCEVHTRSAFLQGLFFMNPEELGEFFNEVKPVLRNLQKQINTLSGSLLKFVLEKDFVDKVVIGVENSIQLRNNLDQIPTSLPLPELNFELSEQVIIPSNWPKM